MLPILALSGCESSSCADSDIIAVGELQLQTLYGPGHTNDSCRFYRCNDKQPMLFTGDTSLIRGTGRTFSKW